LKRQADVERIMEENRKKIEVAQRKLAEEQLRLVEEQRQVLEQRQALERDQQVRNKQQQDIILNRSKSARPPLTFSLGKSSCYLPALAHCVVSYAIFALFSVIYVNTLRRH